MSNRSTKKKSAPVKGSDALLEARARAKSLRAHGRLEREIATATKRIARLVRQRDDSLQRLAEFIIERGGTHRIVGRTSFQSRG